MLDELRLLLGHLGPLARDADYAAAIVDHNVLGKPTRKSRELTLRHMRALYGLDVANPIFRALRRLWPLCDAAQPLLALCVALARDPLLRASQDFILGQPAGATVSRESIEGFLRQTYPLRFSAASLRSFAQNVAGTWTAAGVLRGHRVKIRSQPPTHPESVALVLFLGYLEGRSGQRLFSSKWAKLLTSSTDELEALADVASRRGLLLFMSAGGVKEVRFPGYLSPEEERMRQEVSHVV